MSESLEQRVALIKNELDALEEKRREDIRKCAWFAAQYYPYYKSETANSAIRAAFPEAFKEKSNG